MDTFPLVVKRADRTGLMTVWAVEFEIATH